MTDGKLAEQRTVNVLGVVEEFVRGGTDGEQDREIALHALDTIRERLPGDVGCTHHGGASGETFRQRA